MHSKASAALNSISVLLHGVGHASLAHRWPHSSHVVMAIHCYLHSWFGLGLAIAFSIQMVSLDLCVVVEIAQKPALMQYWKLLRA